MTPESIITACAEDGVQLVLADDGMKARGDTAWIEAWLPILREHKQALIVELHRQRRHAEVMKMLKSAPGTKYAICVDDPSSDPVVCTVGIRGLASFSLEIPLHSFNPEILLELVEHQASETQQPPHKPSSLLDIARGKLRNSHAGTPPSDSQTPGDTRGSPKRRTA